MMEVFHHCQIVKGARMSDQNPLSEQEFASAVDLLRELLPDEELNRIQPSGPATIYTTMVTLWMMTLQRLGGGKTLNAIVKDVLAHNRANFMHVVTMWNTTFAT